MENQNSQISPFSAITPAHIQDWKARHGADSLSEVAIKIDESKNAKFVICKPTRTVMDLVGQHGINKNVVATNKALIANCVLGGDMEIMEQSGSVYSSLLHEVNAQLEVCEVEVKKL